MALNSLIESGVINELPCGSNFAYILKDNSDFLLTEYKVLQSQGNDGFIKCMKMLYNGQIQLYYLTSGYKSLYSMLSAMDSEAFAAVFANLLKCIIDVKANGFLACQNIDISFDKIFVDTATLKTYLIYLPVKSKEYDSYQAFENELRTRTVKLIDSTTNLSSSKTAQLSTDLSDGRLSLEDLYGRIKGIRRSVKKEHAKDNAEQINGSLRIVAMNAPMRVEIEVNKDEYIIGKNSSAADGVITFNKAISRVHCKISRNTGKYYITDLGSANGTYVNKVRLQPNQPHSINNGDIIRLANSDFQVCVG